MRKVAEKPEKRDGLKSPYCVLYNRDISWEHIMIRFDEWLTIREFTTDTDPMQSAINAVKNLHTMSSQQAYGILGNARQAAESEGNADLVEKIRKIEYEYAKHVRAVQRGIEEKPERALQHLITNALSSLMADPQQTAGYLSSGVGSEQPPPARPVVM